MSALVFTAYLIILGTGYWLKYLNLTYLKAHGKTVPPEFQGVVDPALLEKITDYTFENSRVGYFESILGNILTILFLFAGLLGVYDRWILSSTGSLLLGGLLFSLIMLYAETLIDIPFSLYRNFKIEIATASIPCPFASGLLISSSQSRSQRSWVLWSFSRRSRSSRPAPPGGGSGYGLFSWSSVFSSCISRLLSLSRSF